MEVTTSIRGHMYTKKCVSKTIIRWECSQCKTQSCKGAVITDSVVQTFIRTLRWLRVLCASTSLDNLPARGYVAIPSNSMTDCTTFATSRVLKRRYQTHCRFSDIVSVLSNFVGILEVYRRIYTEEVLCHV